MSNDYLISIIVPIYNCAEYVDECLYSIVNQTYKKIEIIVIDDGSTDGSGKICDEWQKRDSRIKVIHSHNCGVSHARNIGLDNAIGDYIGFVDADDWIDLDFYELMLQEIIDKNSDAVGVGYIRENISGGIITLRKSSSRTFSREEILQEIFSRNIPKILYWELWDKLFKKDLVTNIRFDESIAIAEDMLFFWQLMKNVNKFSYMPLFKYHYRVRAGSAVHSGFSSKSISGLKAIRYIWNLSQFESKRIKSIIKQQYVHILIGMTKQMMIYAIDTYAKDIMKNQKEIRANLFSFLLTPNLSITTIMGMLFFCLPFSFCHLFLWALKNREFSRT